MVPAVLKQWIGQLLNSPMSTVQLCPETLFFALVASMPNRCHLVVKLLAKQGTEDTLQTAPEGRLGMSDVSPLSGISGLSFDSTLISPLLFFCLVLLPFLSYLFQPARPFF